MYYNHYLRARIKAKAIEIYHLEERLNAWMKVQSETTPRMPWDFTTEEKEIHQALLEPILKAESEQEKYLNDLVDIAVRTR